MDIYFYTAKENSAGQILFCLSAIVVCFCNEATLTGLSLLESNLNSEALLPEVNVDARGLEKIQFCASLVCLYKGREMVPEWLAANIMSRQDEQARSPPHLAGV